ncbi:MAG TPA: hypothetical protein H9849_08195, partial [Candidatus Anaerobutyricum stercoripullorum]|nr:hypothetical protein [Candidatus Anaerobutyricum stercoripullorum]
SSAEQNSRAERGRFSDKIPFRASAHPSRRDFYLIGIPTEFPIRQKKKLSYPRPLSPQYKTVSQLL